MNEKQTRNSCALYPENYYQNTDENWFLLFFFLWILLFRIVWSGTMMMMTTTDGGDSARHDIVNWRSRTVRFAAQIKRKEKFTERACTLIVTHSGWQTSLFVVVVANTKFLYFFFFGFIHMCVVSDAHMNLDRPYIIAKLLLLSAH